MLSFCARALRAAAEPVGGGVAMALDWVRAWFRDLGLRAAETRGRAVSGGPRQALVPNLRLGGVFRSRQGW